MLGYLVSEDALGPSEVLDDDIGYQATAVPAGVIPYFVISNLTTVGA